MKQSKITIIQDYLKQYQPSVNQIISIKKKKDNYIINCTIYSTQTITIDQSEITKTLDQIYAENKVSNIYEQKTYIIPQKDIQFPTKRKLPKIKKIHRS